MSENKNKAVAVYFSDEEKQSIAEDAESLGEGQGTIVRTIVQDFYGFAPKPYLLAALKKLVGKK